MGSVDSLATLMKKGLSCSEMDLQLKGHGQCQREEAIYGILSCVLGFITSLLMLFYYSMDPIDCDLLINE